MTREFSTKSNRKCKLVRKAKWTSLFINDMETPFQMWANESIALILKTPYFDEQVEWFTKTLK